MRRLAFIISLLMGLQPAYAGAAGNPVVIELFTSQGCSSCPPADALLKEIGAADDVIALSWHVDYWDYIGWKDVFAKPEYTTRQKYYAHAMQEKMIYTPQMVFNGVTHEIGSDRDRVTGRLDALRKDASIVDLEAVRDGDVLRISAQNADTKSRKIDVYVIHYIEKSMVEITRGENAGLTSTYSNIVSDWRTVGQWNGRGKFNLDVPLTSDLPIVVLLQADGFGQILGARKVK